jgi:radical SAM protein with 4Fe4S-binding SPASM domain
MNILRAGAGNAAKIIHRKKLRRDGQYRLSLYAYPFFEGGRYLLLHTLTGEVLELTAAEWADILPLRDASRGHEFIARKGLTELAEKRYLVETDHDEAHAYAQVLFVLRTVRERKKGLSVYTILPTTGCNARCVYCYEEGVPVQTMTEATVDRLIDFVCETKDDGSVKLRWFGGEPLAAVSVIRRACAALEERGVAFSSDMITNASLMTRELAHEAKERWHLKTAQVSLDGAREDYALRKRYVQPERHNYDGVMQAIRFLADEDICVNLRVNVDLGNLPRIEGFLDEMGTAFGDRKNVTLYLAALFQEQGSAHYAALQEAIFALRDKIRAKGLERPSNAAKKGRLSLNYCMADNLDSAIVIMPDGRFFHCEHLPAGQSWGNIFDGVTDPALFEALRRPHEIDPECAGCPFLPNCTPFKRRGCPDCPASADECRLSQRLETEDMLRQLLCGEVAEA